MCFSKNAARRLPEPVPIRDHVQPLSPRLTDTAEHSVSAVSLLAHDINNILAHVMIHLDWARQNMKGDTAVLRQLNSALSALAQGKELIDDVRLARGSRRCPVGPLQLAPVLTETVEVLSNANDPSIDLQCRIDPETPRVHITRAELIRVVRNLVLNARRAISSKPGRIRILVDFVRLTDRHARFCGGQRGGLYVRIVVSDDGAGMSEQTRMHAFEPRVTTKLGQPGAGLGLTIVKAIATCRDGFVTLCSEPGNGTDVTVFLPAA